MRTLPSRFEPFRNVFIGINCLEKLCTKCKRTQEITKFFSKDPDREYGFYSQCNECLNDYGVAFRQKQLAKVFDNNKIKKCNCGLLYTAIKANVKNIDRCQTCIRKQL